MVLIKLFTYLEPSSIQNIVQSGVIYFFWVLVSSFCNLEGENSVISIYPVKIL